MSFTKSSVLYVILIVLLFITGVLYDYSLRNSNRETNYWKTKYIELVQRQQNDSILLEEYQRTMLFIINSNPELAKSFSYAMDSINRYETTENE